MIRREDVTCKIVPRWNSQRHPFCEVLYTFRDEAGRLCHALTRYWHQLSDTPHARAAEVEAFLGRQNR